MQPAGGAGALAHRAAGAPIELRHSGPYELYELSGHPEYAFAMSVITSRHSVAKSLQWPYLNVSSACEMLMKTLPNSVVF